MLSFRKPKGGPAPISAAEAVERARAGTLTVIDVREASEVAATGKAAGALHIPLAFVKMRCDPKAPDCPADLADTRPVALYCGMGGRSQMAGQALCDLGYTEVYNLGGFGDWVAAGGPIER